MWDNPDVPNELKTVALSFDTLTAAVETIRSWPMGPCGNMDTTVRGWCETSLAQMFKLALHGWPEGARMASERAMALAGRIAATSLHAPVFEVAYDVTGAAFDQGALIQGMPEAWAYVNPQPQKRAIRLALNCAVSAGVPQSAIMQRGLAVTALALVLQGAGHPITIDVYQVNGNCPTHRVRLADASTGSQLDLDRVVFGLAHPGMYRVVFGSLTMRYKRAPGTSDWWGRNAPADGPPDAEPVDILINAAHARQAERWQDGGERWVMEEYTKQTREG